jgi:hypothetical protein
MSPADIPSAEQLYETLLERSSLPLPGLEDAIKEMTWRRASTIHDYLENRADRLDEDCILCYEKKARRSHTRYVYETPWDDKETEKPFCSDMCAEGYLHEGDFAYFWCEPCGREICEQHPMNGWHIQYRTHEGEQICLRCYEEFIIENGVERDKLEEGHIPGMFFSHGNAEPIKAGYREVPGFTSYFVNGQESANRFRKKALELMDEGHMVTIGYERLAIGGSEGYVTLMARKSEHNEEVS